ncbi:MAG: nucleotidyltransferase domain-containing protein [Candidatus Nanoarchaeia archaeon]|nr:nucleotidyltransferase domain-containing protein [Candidatus Nanoarchaeia archaeon]
MILKNTKLRNKLKALVAKNRDVNDILVFGSTIRGKEKPNDIDVIVIFKDKINKETEYAIRKELEKNYKNISIISKTEKSALDKAFDARESLLFEAKSLITEKNLAEEYNFHSFGMFKYNFGDWDKLKKTKFYYALNGRGNREGIADMLNCIKLSDSLILAPLEKIEAFKEFLDSWEIKYKYIPVLLPERLSKKKILE